MNREVNLTKRVQTPQGWRYRPVPLSANGRVKPDVVLVDDREERHPEGAYYLGVRLSVGKNAADAGVVLAFFAASWPLFVALSRVNPVPERASSKRSYASDRERIS